jgi:RluA family pseudouridine synthase
MSCKVIISGDHEGRRLDHVIRSIWPALPLSALMRAIRKGEVRLDAARTREPGARVHSGQELYVPWEEPEDKRRGFPEQRGPREKRGPSFERPRRDLPILWRGENVLIVNKPAGLLVQPDVKDGDSVVTRVWSLFGAGTPGFSPAAVHRLDRNTTGVLAVALSGDALRALEGLFRDRLVTKRYLAVVAGTPPASGTVDVPLLKDEAKGIVRAGLGKTAKTRYERLDGKQPLIDANIGAKSEPFLKGELSLVSIELLTGRTHQARAHMAHIGHPILGDGKYGNFLMNRRWKTLAKRPLLHAFELGFPSEVPEALRALAEKTFRAELPEDMAVLLSFQSLL